MAVTSKQAGAMLVILQIASMCTSMKVEYLKEKDWLDFLYQCKGSTFFHTPYWYKVWRAYKGYQYEARLFTFSDGQKVIFPYAWRPRYKGLFRDLLSGPAGVYGGPLSPQAVPEDKFTMIWRNLKRDFDALDVRLCPYQEVEVGGEVKAKSDFTQYISLTELHKNKIDKGWSKGHKSAARKAKNDGLNIKQKNEELNWRAYYEAYQESVRRWGKEATSGYEYKLFEEIYKNVPANNYKLWTAWEKDSLIYGCLCFYFNRHLVYWSGAGLKNYFYLKPAHRLQFEIVSHAVHHQYQWYDFNPSGGHEGVVRFKKGFGAKKIASTLISFHSIAIRSLVSLYNLCQKK